MIKDTPRAPKNPALTFGPTVPPSTGATTTSTTQAPPALRLEQHTKDGHTCLTLHLPNLPTPQAQRLKAVLSLHLANRYKLLPAARNPTAPEQHTIELDLSWYESLGFDGCMQELQTAVRLTNAFGFSPEVLEAVLNAGVKSEAEVGLLIEAGAGADAPAIVQAMPGMRPDQADRLAQLCMALLSDRDVDAAAIGTGIDILTNAMNCEQDEPVHNVLMDALLLCHRKQPQAFTPARTQVLARLVVSRLDRLELDHALRPQLCRLRSQLLLQAMDSDFLPLGLVRALLESRINEAVLMHEVKPKFEYAPDIWSIDHEVRMQRATRNQAEGPCDDLIEEAVVYLFNHCALSDANHPTIPWLLAQLQRLPGERAAQLRQQCEGMVAQLKQQVPTYERHDEAAERIKLQLKDAGLSFSLGTITGSGLTLTTGCTFDPDLHTPLLLDYAATCHADWAPMVLRFLLEQPGLPPQRQQQILRMAYQLAAEGDQGHPLPHAVMLKWVAACIQLFSQEERKAELPAVWPELLALVQLLDDPALAPALEALPLSGDQAVECMTLRLRLATHALTTPSDQRQSTALIAAAMQMLPVLVDTATSAYLHQVDRHFAVKGDPKATPTLRTLNTPQRPSNEGSLHTACVLWQNICLVQTSLALRTDPANMNTTLITLSEPRNTAQSVLRLFPADPVAVDRPVLGLMQTLLASEEHAPAALIALGRSIKQHPGFEDTQLTRGLFVAMNHNGISPVLLRDVVCVSLFTLLKLQPGAINDVQVRATIGATLSKLQALAQSRMAALLMVELTRKTGWFPLMLEGVGDELARSRLVKFIGSSIWKHRAEFSAPKWIRALSVILCNPTSSADGEATPEWMLKLHNNVDDPTITTLIATVTMTSLAGSSSSSLNELNSYPHRHSDGFEHSIAEGMKLGTVVGSLMVLSFGAIFLMLDDISAQPQENSSSFNALRRNKRPALAFNQLGLVGRWPAAEPYLQLGDYLRANFLEIERASPTEKDMIRQALQALIDTLRSPQFHDRATKPAEVMEMHQAIAEELDKVLSF